MITSSDVFLQVRSNSVAGMHDPSKEIYHNSKLPMNIAKKVEKSNIDEQQFLTMSAYAKWLPHGKRQLKLNYPELRDMLVATDLTKAPLTKESGLNSGGKIAMDGLKAMSQKEHMTTILNTNRVRNDSVNYGGFNPSYTSFKNKLELK